MVDPTRSEHLQAPLSSCLTDDDAVDRRRMEKYWAVAEQKRKSSTGDFGNCDYYASLVNASSDRVDVDSEKDRRQISKDLPRTFAVLPLKEGTGSPPLLPVLHRILSAYIERGRSLSSTSLKMRVVGPSREHIKPTQTSLKSRSVLTSYPQGLNLFAGMSLLVAGAGRWDGQGATAAEEIAFWLLALLLEDVLDPDFFWCRCEG
jgi:hypothetical protein